MLLLLYPGGAGPATILTRRSADLPLHGGQICLPGGRVHAGDASLEVTALREASEETGLDPAGVRILGRLPGTLVSSGIEVMPVVGWMASQPVLAAEPREVVELIECPLAVVLDPASYRLDTIVSDDIKRELYFIEFNGYYVWGATASILRSFALALNGGETAGRRRGL